RWTRCAWHTSLGNDYSDSGPCRIPEKRRKTRQPAACGTVTGKRRPWRCLARGPDTAGASVAASVASRRKSEQRHVADAVGDVAGTQRRLWGVGPGGQTPPAAAASGSGVGVEQAAALRDRARGWREAAERVAALAAVAAGIAAAGRPAAAEAALGVRLGLRL